MRQEAPRPDVLFTLVEGLTYKPGWKFALLEDYDRGQGSVGLTLDITTNARNSYHPERMVNVHHLMIVPAASYDARSWSRWLLEQIILVERHEACEFFTLPGGKPYAPHHGPGNDPYIIFEHGTDLDVRTNFRGAVNP